MENLLIAENIRSFFPEAGPFSLTIHAGDRCHVQGSSRSCNALFEIFTGLRKPDEGSVTVRGKNVYEMSETERAAFRRDKIGAVPKGGGFLPELTLLEQVRLPMVLGGLSRDEIQNRIRKNAFDYLPLHDLYNQGKRCTPQTLALASLLRASVMNPPILILNASFEHLCGKDAELVWQEVKTILPKEHGFLYLGSTPAPTCMHWTEQISGR